MPSPEITETSRMPEFESLLQNGDLFVRGPLQALELIDPIS